MEDGFQLKRPRTCSSNDGLAALGMELREGWNVAAGQQLVEGMQLPCTKLEEVWLPICSKTTNTRTGGKVHTARPHVLESTSYYTICVPYDHMGICVPPGLLQSAYPNTKIPYHKEYPLAIIKCVPYYKDYLVLQSVYPVTSSIPYYKVYPHYKVCTLLQRAPPITKCIPYHKKYSLLQSVYPIAKSSP